MQTKRKIVFDPSTLQFNYKKNKNRKFVVFCIGGLFLTGLALMVFFGSFVTNLSPDQENSAQKELVQLELKYKELTNKINGYEKKLAIIHERDAQVYSTLMGVDPLDDDIWEGGTGGKHKSRSGLGFNNMNADKIEDKADKLGRQLNLQTQSLEKMLSKVRVYEEMLECIPSIKPVKEAALNRDVHLLSGFGKRIHPVFKIWKMHEGIDFSCPRGTKIVSSGKGVVDKINGNGRGFGQHILVDHGFGYKTLYAHLSSINVKVGQRVERGTYIGQVGSTGTATAPHLHYEVHKDGKAIDPIHYVLDGLDPKEYDLLLKQAAVEGKSMD